MLSLQCFFALPSLHLFEFFEFFFVTCFTWNGLYRNYNMNKSQNKTKNVYRNGISLGDCCLKECLVLLHIHSLEKALLIKDMGGPGLLSEYMCSYTRV